MIQNFFLIAYNSLVIEMNEIDTSKYVNIIKKNKTNETTSKRNNIKKYFMNLIIRMLVVIVILISIAIVYKSNSNLKDSITTSFFKDDISFTKIKKIYDKYLGGVLPIKSDKHSVTEVFDEKLTFAHESIYYDGVKLAVVQNYLVPSLDEGMVVFIGDKENYGKTVIIENLDGINFWYGNIDVTSLKLYDYVEKGSLIGEVKQELYMVFSKGGNYLDYEDFIY